MYNAISSLTLFNYTRHSYCSCYAHARKSLQLRHQKNAERVSVVALVVASVGTAAGIMHWRNQEWGQLISTVTQLPSVIVAWSVRHVVVY